MTTYGAATLLAALGWGCLLLAMLAPDVRSRENRCAAGVMFFILAALLALIALFQSKG